MPRLDDRITVSSDHAERMAGMGLGNVPSWVGALLTGSSLGVASFTYYRTAGDRRRTQHEAERGQAARVSLWWTNPRKGWVRNGNDVAVTVRAFLRAPDGTSWSAYTDRIGLGPGETRGLLRSAQTGEAPAPVLLDMVDSYGRAWIRHGDGTLNRRTAADRDSSDQPPLSRDLRWDDR